MITKAYQSKEIFLWSDSLYQYFEKYRSKVLRYQYTINKILLNILRYQYTVLSIDIPIGKPSLHPS